MFAIIVMPIDKKFYSEKISNKKKKVSETTRFFIAYSWNIMSGYLKILLLGRE